MKIVENYPYEIIEEDNIWIPVTDGLKLSARIWRPKGSENAPVPAILEYIPYRKRFGTAHRDQMNHQYMAGHGYACIRLDIRGSGESEGVLTDEYLQSELDDGVEAIKWLTRQDWCDGNVGMVGISWGGFNGLQIAAMQPEALKAIVTICSTDDRYSDDIHHMGGTLLSDNLSWAAVMFYFNTMPPDPAVVGERWRDMWRERLQGSGLWIKNWLEHQRRDEFWEHGSVCEDFSKIKIPVFAVSGWADGYTNAVFRLMENLDGPRKGLVGPWSHTYPNFGSPGPAIDFLGEMLRWWDKWLKGKDNGVETEPMIQAWMQDSAPPKPYYEYRPGRWVSEDNWPAANIEQRPYKFGVDQHLDSADMDTEVRELSVQSPVNLGLHGGKWCSYANGPDLPVDQRFDDGGSLVFQTPPLEEAIEIMGAPMVELELSSDRPVAMVAVRLSDVQPDDQVTRVTYGLLNLTHRDGSKHPKMLEPGKTYRVQVPLNYIAQHFPAGHRIRVAVSSVYWPLAWTPPEETRLKIWTGKSRIILPCRPQKNSENIVSFGPPVGATGADITRISPEERSWTIHQDIKQQKSEVVVVDDGGLFRLNDIDLTVGSCGREKYSVISGDFTSARGETEWEGTLQRGDWQIRTRTYTCLTADKDHFYITAELDAYEGDTRFESLSWNEKIPRDLV